MSKARKPRNQKTCGLWIFVSTCMKAVDFNIKGSETRFNNPKSLRRIAKKCNQIADWIESK